MPLELGRAVSETRKRSTPSCAQRGPATSRSTCDIGGAAGPIGASSRRALPLTLPTLDTHTHMTRRSRETSRPGASAKLLEQTWSSRFVRGCPWTLLEGCFGVSPSAACRAAESRQQVVDHWLKRRPGTASDNFRLCLWSSSWQWVQNSAKPSALGAGLIILFEPREFCVQHIARSARLMLRTRCLAGSAPHHSKLSFALSVLRIAHSDCGTLRP